MNAIRFLSLNQILKSRS